MLKRLIQISISALVLLVAACGSGGGDDVEIELFEITGNAEKEDGRAVIYASTNRGEFDVAWEVDDDDANGYYLYLYASVNDEFSNDNDIRFFSTYCGDGSCDHDEENDEKCWFDNDLEMVCDDRDDNKADIDELIDTLPQDLYIIIRACNDSDCATDAIPIRLRS
jgi:hypothetical protein